MPYHYLQPQPASANFTGFAIRFITVTQTPFASFSDTQRLVDVLRTGGALLMQMNWMGRSSGLPWQAVAADCFWRHCGTGKLQAVFCALRGRCKKTHAMYQECCSIDPTQATPWYTAAAC